MLGRIRKFFSDWFKKEDVYYTPYQIDEDGNEAWVPEPPKEKKPRKPRKLKETKKVKRPATKPVKRGRPKKTLK